MVGRIQTRVENLGSAPAPCNENAPSCLINVFYFRVVERAEQFSILEFSTDQAKQLRATLLRRAARQEISFQEFELVRQ